MTDESVPPFLLGIIVGIGSMALVVHWLGLW